MTDKPRLTVVPKHRHQSNQRQAVQRPAKTSGSKTAVNSEGLTTKQEAFCMAILDGKGFSDAYREAYDAANMSAASVHQRSVASWHTP
jgi:hypothetical protein